MPASPYLLSISTSVSTPNQFRLPIIFSSAIDKIESAYKRLGMELGWRFLYTPASTLSCPSGAMLVGLNPGGDEHGVTPSVEEGNAYLVEDWPGDGASLQDQVQQFFAALHQAGAVSGRTQ